MALLTHDHIEVEGIIDSIVVVTTNDFLQIIHDERLLDDPLGELGRLVVLRLEILEVEGTVGWHSAVIECHHELLALGCLRLPLRELLFKGIDRSLGRPIKEECLCLECKLTSGKVLAICEDLAVCHSFHAS